MPSTARSSVENEFRWHNRVVLVTGGSGLLGGSIVRTLVDRRADVTVLMRGGLEGSVLDAEGIRDRIRVLTAPVEDADRLYRVLSGRKFDAIFHNAGQSVVSAADGDLARTLETNVRGAWNVLEYARTTDAGAIVIASTSKVYATAASALGETSPLNGGSVYGVSKLCADLIASMYAGSAGVRAGIARFANLFGGGDRQESRLIPGAIRSTLAGRRFTLRGSPDSIRDYLYVADAVTAELRLAECLASGQIAGEAFNFGMSEPRTNLEVVQAVLRLAGREDLQPFIPNDAAEAPTVEEMDCARSRRVLGWRPEFSFERGLAETIDWYETNARYHPGSAFLRTASSRFAGKEV